METKKQGSAGVAFKWAMIYVATSIILTFLWQFVNVDQTSAIKYVGYVPLIAFLLLAQKEYRDRLGGFMTFGEGFLAGFLYSVFGAIVIAVFTFIYFSFISPQVWQQVLDAQKAALEAKNITGDQADQAMALTQKYGILFAVVGILFVSPIIGAIISLIGAAIFKKEPTLADVERADAPVDPTV